MREREREREGERERERERENRELFTPHFPGSFHDQRDGGYKKQ